MKYCKYILIGGQVRPNGGPAKPAAINFKSHGITLILLALAALFIAPLLFVQSPVGFIPYTNLDNFSSLGPLCQYKQSLTYNILSILKSFLVGDGFPPEIPKPKGIGWQLFVSTVLMGLNALTAVTFWVGVKRIYDNYQTYTRRLK